MKRTNGESQVWQKLVVPEGSSIVSEEDMSLYLADKVYDGGERIHDAFLFSEIISRDNGLDVFNRSLMFAAIAHVSWESCHLECGGLLAATGINEAFYLEDYCTRCWVGWGEHGN